MKDLMKLDLYELLNIKTTASESEIKKAYRKKALTCHPDKNPDPKAGEDFKQLTKAMEILTNDFTRADYDKLFRQRKREKVASMRSKEKAARKAAREKEDAERKKQFKEKEKEKRKDCSYKKDTNRTYPTWPPSSMCPCRRFMNFKREYPARKKKERTERAFPTWPPTSPKPDYEIYSDSKEEADSSSNFNFTPIVRPATFVAPSCSEFKNLWQGSSQIFSPKSGTSKTSSPLIKPAKFVAPSNSKNSDGFHDAHQKGSSPILKPATFVAPSMS